MGVVLPFDSGPARRSAPGGVDGVPATGTWAALTLGGRHLDVEVVTVPVGDHGCEGLSLRAYGPADGTDQHVWVRSAPFPVRASDLGIDPE